MENWRTPCETESSLSSPSPLCGSAAPAFPAQQAALAVDRAPNASPGPAAGLSSEDWSGIRAAREACNPGQAWQQEAYIKASNPDFDDHFGVVLAVSGDTVVVGAPAEDSHATGVNGDQASNGAPGSGAVYIFVRNGATWSQQAYLKPSNTELFDSFGTSVAIAGDTVVVGAPGEDSAAAGVGGNEQDNSLSGAGAAYVFVRSGTTWTQQAYLKAFAPYYMLKFGETVAVSGDFVVVGAPFEDINAIGVNGPPLSGGLMNSGAAFVFVRNGTSWSTDAYLKASDTEGGALFGSSLAASGDTLIVGAWGEASSSTGVNGEQMNTAALQSGAAYVFVRNGMTWSQQAYLKASNTGTEDFFGWTVALSKDTAVVGAPWEDSAAVGVNGVQDDENANSAGAAYVFVRSGTSWSQQAYLKASNTGTLDKFGSAVAVHDDTVLVSAPFEDSSATGLNGNQTDNSFLDAGAVYAFGRTGTSWQQRAYLKSFNTTTGDVFGWVVAVADGFGLVGSPREDGSSTGVNGMSNEARADAGAAYAFVLPPPAMVAFRNAGSNPASYIAGPIVIGGTFSATVANGPSGQLTSLLFAFDSAVTLALAGGQTLLCLDLGSGELFTGANLAPSSSAGGVDTYGLAVPNDPTLCGFAFASQAIQFGSPPFDLSNAQDFTIGGL